MFPSDLDEDHGRGLRRRATLLCGLLAGLAPWSSANAQQPYPTRPIRTIVPFPAGGSVDILPRIVGEKLSQKLGQPIVVENRPGAGGNVGAQIVASAPPDGYTLFSSSPGPLTTNQFLYKDQGYDSSKFVPISLLATVPTVLLVRKDLPVKNLQELVELARRQNGAMTFASQGSGTTSHLAGSLFQMLTHTKLTHIPYGGTGPALMALASGQVDVLFDNAGVSINQYRAGRMKMLATVGSKRLELTPDVPTFAEAGLPDFESRAFIALVAPPKTDPALAAMLSRDVDEILKMPDVRKRFMELSAEPYGGTPQDLAAFLAKETARWREVIQTNDISAN